jgi:hypothetical protein
MRYTVEIASDGMIYIPIFVKIGSVVQNLIGGDIHTDIRTDMNVIL